jgi:hypothetical protein
MVQSCMNCDRLMETYKSLRAEGESRKKAGKENPRKWFAGFLRPEHKAAGRTTLAVAHLLESSLQRETSQAEMLCGQGFIVAREAQHFLDERAFNAGQRLPA